MSTLLITGGRGGLAQAVVKEWQDCGNKVYAPSHEELDMSALHTFAPWLKKCSEFPDVYVANAGISFNKLLTRIRPNEWDSVLKVNLTGAVFLAQQLAQYWCEKGLAGHIIFIGSYAGIHPQMGQTDYAASKSALIGCMKTLAREWGSNNIRVNLVCPGYLETSLTESVPVKVKKQALDQHVLKRFTTPQRTARFLRFLQEEMPDVSGQVFSLDSRIL